jgi:selenide, water dikinase
MAVVVTADFFAPVVDDAYTFGRIAATNALGELVRRRDSILIIR